MNRGLSWYRLAALNAAVALSYAALGIAFLSLSFIAVASPIWPSAGLALAVTVRWRWKVLPGILLGSMTTNLVIIAIRDSAVDRPLVTALMLGCGAVLQAAVGAALVRGILEKKAALTRSLDIFLFLLLAGPVAAVVGATFGTFTQVAAGLVNSNDALMAWLVWWAGDSMGVIVFAPIVLMLLPNRKRSWRGWRMKVAVPSLIFASVLTAALMVSDNANESRLAAERQQAAEEASARLLNQLDRQQEVLQGMKSHVESSGFTGEDEFRAYTRDALERFGSLHALSWNPSLTSEQLPGFIANRRQQPGGVDFTVTERDEAGELQPVAPGREQYVVVEYIEPIAENAAALGYDIASNPARAETIEQATISAQMIGTPPIDLVQTNGGSQKGMLVLDPVYGTQDVPRTKTERRNDLVGFTVGVYQLNDLVNEVFTDQVDTDRWNQFAIALFDVTDPAEPQAIGARGTADMLTNQITVLGEPMTVNGRTWQLALTPIAGPLSSELTPATAYLLIAAVIGVYLLEALLLMMTSRERQASSEAVRRAHEANHDVLTGLLNRRGFVARLEDVCERPTESGHVLLFCDLDRFKQVNDEAGHKIGDELLVGIAQTITGHVRGSDTVGRLGGDEFAVILHDCSVTEALRIAEELKQAVTSFRVTTDDGSYGVGVSIGATPIGNGALDASAAIHEADIAAYEAKANAGNAVCVRW